METATLVLGIVDLLMLVALFYIGAKASKIDKLEDAVTAKAEEVVATQFKLLAAEMKAPLMELRTLINAITQRLEHGDEKFTTNGQTLQKLELKTQAHLDQFREEVARTYVTREEWRELSKRIGDVERSLAAYTSTCEARHGERKVRT